MPILRQGSRMVRISREALVGDPIFGAIGRALGGAARFVGRAATAQLGIPTPRFLGGTTAMTRVGPGGFPTSVGFPIPIGPSGLPQLGFDPVADLERRIRTGTGGRSGFGLRMRRRRRINPGNFRALGRALRRIESFERRARRVIRIVRPGAGRVRVRFRRRKRAA